MSGVDPPACVPDLLSDPLVAVQALLLRDFLHEIGQSANVAGFVAYNLQLILRSADRKDNVSDALARIDNLTTALDSFNEVLHLFRGLATKARNSAAANDQWQLCARRVERLTRLVRSRGGTSLVFNAATCPEDWCRPVSELEVVILCLIKENVAGWPVESSAIISIDLTRGSGDGASMPHVRLAIEPDAGTAFPGLAITPMAAWTAHRLGIDVAGCGTALSLSHK